MESINNKSFLYPPGGVLIWIIICVELVTFAAGIIAFSYHGSITPDVYSASRNELNANIGFVNTLILLTSGLCIAQSLSVLKQGQRVKSQKLMWQAILLGLGFLLLKGYEFVDKLEHGFDLAYNTFYMFYWLLAGFHFLHVLVGLIILLVLVAAMRKGVFHKENYLDVETGAAFWHMCDLIWLMLFPVLYLL